MGPFCSLLYALNIAFYIKYSVKAGINKPHIPQYFIGPERAIRLRSFGVSFACLFFTAGLHFSEGMH
jgi:hypothetical protein